jgi:hypothetical protein
VARMHLRVWVGLGVGRKALALDVGDWEAYIGRMRTCVFFE